MAGVSVEKLAASPYSGFRFVDQDGARRKRTGIKYR